MKLLKGKRLVSVLPQGKSRRVVGVACAVREGGRAFVLGFIARAEDRSGDAASGRTCAPVCDEMVPNDPS